MSDESVRVMLKKPTQALANQELGDSQYDAAFVCQMEQVLDEYARPYEQDYPVVCLDESPYQLVVRADKVLPTPKGLFIPTMSTKGKGWQTST